MNCSTKAALSACFLTDLCRQSRILRPDSNVAIGSRVCIRLDPWMEHILLKRLTWAMSCSMLWGSSKLISSLVLAQPDNSQTTFMSNFAEGWSPWRKQIRTKHLYRVRLCFPLPCFGAFFSGAAVPPRQPIFPPLMKRSLKHWLRIFLWQAGCGIAGNTSYNT